MNFDLYSPFVIRAEWLIMTGLLYMAIYVVFIESIIKIYVKENNIKYIKNAILSFVSLIIVGISRYYIPEFILDSKVIEIITYSSVIWYSYLYPILISILTISSFSYISNGKKLRDKMIFTSSLVIWFVFILINALTY